MALAWCTPAHPRPLPDGRPARQHDRATAAPSAFETPVCPPPFLTQTEVAANQWRGWVYVHGLSPCPPFPSPLSRRARCPARPPTPGIRPICCRRGTPSKTAARITVVRAHGDGRWGGERGRRRGAVGRRRSSAGCGLDCSAEEARRSPNPLPAQDSSPAAWHPSLSLVPFTSLWSSPPHRVSLSVGESNEAHRRSCISRPKSRSRLRTHARPANLSTVRTDPAL